MYWQRKEQKRREGREELGRKERRKTFNKEKKEERKTFNKERKEGRKRERGG